MNPPFFFGRTRRTPRGGNIQNLRQGDGSHAHGDAQVIIREFEPVFGHELVSLANHDIYLRLLIDGYPSRPFSATTLAPPPNTPELAP